MVHRALRIAQPLFAVLVAGAIGQARAAPAAGDAAARGAPAKAPASGAPAGTSASKAPVSGPAAEKPAEGEAAGRTGGAEEAEAAADKGAPADLAAPGASDNFDLKVKNLEESVNELKEKIFRTKARLLLLQETVLGGDITSGAKAVIVHKNEMGATYTLEQASYALDGAPIFTRLDESGELGKKRELEIFNGRIVPGNHQITVQLQYRGHGFGVFSYIEGYRFKVQSSYTFNAEGGKVTQVRVVGYEKGNITTDVKDRPAVKYDVEVTRDSAQRQATADAQKPAGGKKP